MLPEIKLITILGNPVERAISDFQYSWKYGLNGIDFSGFISRGISDIRKGDLVLHPFHSSAILWKGFYTNQLEDYLKYTRHDNLGVFLFEDMINDPGGFKAGICRFLGVPNDLGLILEQVNARSVTRPVPDKARIRLVEFYERDVRRLAMLIGRNLDHWLD